MSEHIDKKELIASILFDYEYQNEEGRPLEREAHDLAEKILNSLAPTPQSKTVINWTAEDLAEYANAENVEVNENLIDYVYECVNNDKQLTQLIREKIDEAVQHYKYIELNKDKTK